MIQISPISPANVVSNEQALVSQKIEETVDAVGGRTFAVTIEDGYMAK